MPRIVIHNVQPLLMKLQKGESRLKDELNEKYRLAIDMIGLDIARGAVENLNKPAWQLSEAIRASRLKDYKKTHVIFKAVESENSMDPKPNTPGAYAFYQEHGYVVKASNVRRPEIGKTKGTGKKASYRRAEGKKFFKTAAETYFPKLRDEIAKINEETRLKLE